MEKTILLTILLYSLLACSRDSPINVPDKQEPIEPPVTESSLQGSFESKFVRYAKGQLFVGQSDKSKIVTVWKDTVWQNDRVHKQLVLWSDNKRYDKLTYQVSDLTSGEKSIPSSCIRLRFPSYVMGDANAFTCGEYSSHSTIWIADALPEAPVTTVNTVEPVKVWVTADIPSDVPPGLYSGSITVESDGELQQTFALQFLVTAYRLPPVSEWEFHLDLWQFPYQLANLCTDNSKKIVPFSDAHFSLLKPFYRLLADAGQKAITTYIKDGAFNTGQTMIKWSMNNEGAWNFDYTDFDRYVSTMMSWGIDKQINCFSMVGWNTSIGYTDALGEAKTLNLMVGSDEYNAVWTDFLDSFRTYLKSKGWFEKTVLYMDEIKKMRCVILSHCFSTMIQHGRLVWPAVLFRLILRRICMITARLSGIIEIQLMLYPPFTQVVHNLIQIIL